MSVYYDLGLVVGPQGPRGETGPQGPQGPQGPKGDAGDVAMAQLTAASASGAVANFCRLTGGLPVDDLVIDIDPIQAGSGTPSPSNVRSISGRTGATIYRSGADTSDPSATSVSWNSEAGTVYGGTLDVTTGLLTVTHKRADMGSFNWYYSSGGKGTFRSGPVSDLEAPATNRDTASVYCEVYPTTYSYNLYTTGTNAVGIAVNTDANIWVHDDQQGTDAAAFKTAMSGYYVVYPLAAASQTTYQLTPAQISSLLGENNIWADSGNVYVTFGQDVKGYIDDSVDGKQDAVSVSGVLQGDGQGGISARAVDTAPAADSTALITSGAVYTAIIGAMGGSY